jgi:hypothetical protein
MGLFDSFSNQDAQDAANAQKAGIQSGLTQATGQINQGNQALTTNYTQALQPFLQNYGTANAGVNQLTNLLGITAPTTGTVGTSPSGAPASPVAPMMPAIGGAGGVGGAATSAGPGGVPGSSQPGPSTANSILQTLQNTPGYQFQLQQGNNAINAKAAATGSLDSGNTLLDLSKFNQGLAGTTYQNAVSNLMPFLQSSNANAGGIASTYGAMGQGLNSNFGSLANLDYTAATGQGNAQANADLANYQASGNLWNMFGNAASSAAKIWSDFNLKEDIEPVGELFDGTNVYRYRYKGDSTPRIGVMAQEVEQTRPDAVVEIGGFKAVDYGRATDLAAALGKFIEGGDNVVKLDNARSATPVDTFSRFLEAA